MADMSAFGGAECLRYPDDTNVWMIFHCYPNWSPWDMAILLKRSLSPSPGGC